MRRVSTYGSVVVVEFYTASAITLSVVWYVLGNDCRYKQTVLKTCILLTQHTYCHSLV